MKNLKYFLFSVIAVFILSMSLIRCSTKQNLREKPDLSGSPDAWGLSISDNASELLEKGKAVFRFETFGDEAFWTDKLQLHKAIAGSKHGGIGEGLTPEKAIQAGLKVDLAILPGFLKKEVADGNILKDVAVTMQLIKLNAVLGVVGKFDGEGNMTAVGFTCALCHSTVASPTGIGVRLDGWPNRDLNVGAIVAMAPDLSAFEELLGVDNATVKKVLNSWGPGKYDAELNMDGKAFRPDGKSGATLIPEAFGHAGHNQHTWTGGWGNVTYWNAYVANTQLMGNGTFYDPRMMDKSQFPVAAKAGTGNKRPKGEDMVTDKLAALQFYQLAMPAPKAPDTVYNKDMAERGKLVFEGKAKCTTCHVPPLYSEPGWGTHKGDEICIDDFQSSRSPDKSYVTQGLKGLWSHMKGGFYHDGRFATLMDVVNHYNTCKNLKLTETEKNDLVEYLKSI
jgi:hypothetical protein